MNITLEYPSIKRLIVMSILCILITITISCNTIYKPGSTIIEDSTITPATSIQTRSAPMNTSITVPHQTPKTPTFVKPLPIILDTSTATPTIVSTKMSSTIEVEKITPPLILQYLLGGEIIFQNVNTGEYWKLDPKFKLFDGYFLGWTHQGCRFLLRSTEHDILEIGLHGQIYRTVFSYQDFHYHGEGKPLWEVDLSPSQDKIAFNVISGELKDYSEAGSHFDREDLFVSAFDGHTDIHQLTLNGGAWYHQWSPDNQGLIYTDYNEQGQFELYYSTIDEGKKIRLSLFDDSNKVPQRFLWSPNGQYVLMESIHTGNFIYSVTVFDLNSGKTVAEFPNVYQAWWEENSIITIWKGENISWIDLSMRKTIQQVIGVPKPNTHLHPFGSNDKFGCFWNCFGGYRFNPIVYDVKQNKLIRLSHTVLIRDTAGYYALPNTFPGEAVCEK